MKLHEYQAKRLLADYSIPVPAGGAATTPEEARLLAESLSGSVVVKAQIHAGARGKAGGIISAGSPSEAEHAAKTLLGSRLSTIQTGAGGLPVHTVLVEQSVTTAREYYCGILVDPSHKRPMLVASAHGGTEIEELAARNPEEIASTIIDPVTGLLAYQARNIVRRMGLDGVSAGKTAQLLTDLYRLFMEKDCSLVEINPLVLTTDGALLALDAKITVDDNALFRHPELASLRDDTQVDPLEQQAARIGVSYVKMEGSIGCLVNGAGLAMATMDIVEHLGGRAANFLDVGGAADEHQVTAALRLLLEDADVRVAWINIFGGILRCDTVARALKDIYANNAPRVPFVVRMHGTNAYEATQLLGNAPMSIMLEPDLAAAARLAVATAGTSPLRKKSKTK